MKKVLLWTTPRSASTTYLQKIADDNPGMINHKESLRTLDWGYHTHRKTDAERKQQFKNLMRSWENPTTSNCIKMFPLMITEPHSPWRNDSFLIEKLLPNATDNIFLMRNDFIAQVRSLAVAYYMLKQPTNSHSNFHGSWEEPFIMPDTKLVDDLVQTCNRQTYAQIFQIMTIYKNIPSSIMSNKKLIWVEDIDQSNKYHRPVVWTKEPSIVYLDVKEQFDIMLKDTPGIQVSY
tara:strand:- start:43205 stop:43906 length:702 start_codon:yes stop_codon:yes gene_type:complete